MACQSTCALLETIQVRSPSLSLLWIIRISAELVRMIGSQISLYPSTRY